MKINYPAVLVATVVHFLVGGSSGMDYCFQISSLS